LIRVFFIDPLDDRTRRWQAKLQRPSSIVRSDLTMKSLRRKEIFIPVLLFVLALGIRLIYLHQMRSLPYFDHPIVDAEYNDRWAAAISQGAVFQEGPYFRAPLYPYFLALIYLLFGHSYLAARLAQFLLGAGSVVLIFLLGRRIFGRTAGTVAGVLAALTGTLVYFEGELLIPALFLFLNLLLVLSLLEAADRRRTRWWLLSGALLGLAAIARPNVLVFGAAIVVWMAIVLKKSGLSRGRILAAAAVYLLGALLVIAPVTVRNALVGGDLVPIASQGGMNLYIGNHPASDGVTAVLPGAPDDFWGGYHAARRGAEEAAGHPLRDSQVSNYWFSRGLRFWKEQPGQAMALTARKLALFWSGAEIANNKDIYFLRRRIPILGLLIRPGPLYLPFGLIAPLALAGMILAWRRRGGLDGDRRRGEAAGKSTGRPRSEASGGSSGAGRPGGEAGCNGTGAGLMALFVFAYMASIIPFFVTARFRLPVVPFLLIFAGFTLTAFFRIQSAAWKIPAVVCIAVLGLLVNLNLAGYPLPPPATSHVSLGHLYLEKGQLERAEREFAQALTSLTPSSRLSDPHRHALAGLARVYAGTSRADRGIDLLGEAVSKWPAAAELHFQLGHLFYRQGRLEQAVASWQRTVELDPSFQQAHLELGIAHEDGGRFEQALEAYHRAIRIDPDYTLARYNLGMLYTRLGRLPEAVQQFQEVIATDPGFADAYAGLAWIFARHGVRLDEARELIGRAIELDPDRSWYRDVLAEVHISAGRPERAAAIFREMIRREPGNGYWKERMKQVGG
jgi:tetratricopeptide (TPR) repeat protein